MHDHSDFFELLRANSLGQAHAEMERAGILCTGPLGFHKPRAFTGRGPKYCLSCEKLIYMSADTCHWTAMAE